MENSTKKQKCSFLEPYLSNSGCLNMAPDSKKWQFLISHKFSMGSFLETIRDPELKFSGISYLIDVSTWSRFYQNSRRSSGKIFKNWLFLHGMTLLKVFSQKFVLDICEKLEKMSNGIFFRDRRLIISHQLQQEERKYYYGYM